MAVSKATIAAGQYSALNADKPFFVCNNVIGTAHASDPASLAGSATPHVQWRENGDWQAGDDDTDSSYLTSNLYDGHLHRASKPTTYAARSTHNLIMNIEEGTTDLYKIDTLVILGHNFDDIGANSTNPILQLTISDSSDFSTTTGSQLLGTYLGNPGFSAQLNTGKRICVFDLTGSTTSGDYDQWTNARYIKLKISSNANFAVAPEIGELILGKRIQLSYKSNHPYSDDDTDSLVSEFVSETGHRSSYVKRKGQAVFNLRHRATNSSATYTIDDEQQWKDFNTLTDYGTKPFLFVPNPDSTEITGSPDDQGTSDAYWVRRSSPAFRLPYNTLNIRDMSMELLEIPPFVSSE